jgi:hypothetical protein
MKKALFVFTISLLFIGCKNDSKTASSSTTNADSSKKQPQSEFADAKYAEWGKKMIDQFSAGNMDAWLNNFADTAVYQWSSGDRLTGKKAISDYWMKRRTEVIDSIKMSNDIWLPLKVNTPQKGPDVPGIWLMGWYQVDVKYKNGKKLTFWTHIDNHYDASDKIDRSIQYIDMAPIKAALGQ